jgi:hypothetical protein
MSKAKWLLFSLVVCAALLVPTEASAIGCWVCENALDSCFYYRSVQHTDCWNACTTTTCRNACNRNYELGILQCYANYDYCSAGCIDNDDDWPPENCPVVIDLGQNNVEFTSADDGVLFDINDDGRPEAVAWTDAEAGDGFLVFDRNRNGVIDSGRELFGNATPQPPADGNQNGFLALALFDDNQDGVISSLDGIFNGLRIWVDANHNGKSEAGELTTLAANGIVLLEVDYKESRRKDRHGNELRYRARVQLENGHTNAIDVFLNVK